MLKSCEIDLSRAMVPVLVSGPDIIRIPVIAFPVLNEAPIEGEDDHNERFYPPFLPIDCTRNGSCFINKDIL